MSKGKEKLANYLEPIKTVCAVGSLLVAILALVISKKAERAVANLTTTQGPAGIVQSGGRGSFSIGDMRVGASGPQQPPKEYGLEGARTIFSDLANSALRSRALAVVDRIRQLVTQAETDRVNTSPFTSEFINTKSDEEKQRLWLASTAASQKLWTESKAAYESRFRVDALLLRDEIRSRLPKASYPRTGLYETLRELQISRRSPTTLKSLRSFWRRKMKRLRG